MAFCKNLQIVPAHFNLASLEHLNLLGCPQLRKFPDISSTITALTIADTMLEELLESIRLCSRLESLHIFGSVNTLPDPYSAKRFLNRSRADIEKIPDCIKDLHGLKLRYISGCPKLASLPELPTSLRRLRANTCESLKTVSFSSDSPIEDLYFTNCFKLGHEARKVITQQSVCVKACLPGSKMSEEFDHRAIGKSLSTRSGFNRFKICVVISPKQQKEKAFSQLLCRISSSCCLIDENIVYDLPIIQTKHLCIAQSKLLDEDGRLELDKEILFEFSTTNPYIDIIECGVRILTSDRRNNYGLDQVWEDGDDLSYKYEPNKVFKDSEKAYDEEENNGRGKEQAYCWSWFVLCFDLSHIFMKIGNLGWGTRQQHAR